MTQILILFDRKCPRASPYVYDVLTKPINEICEILDLTNKVGPFTLEELNTMGFDEPLYWVEGFLGRYEVPMSTFIKNNPYERGCCGTTYAYLFKKNTYFSHYDYIDSMLKEIDNKH